MKDTFKVVRLRDTPQGKPGEIVDAKESAFDFQIKSQKGEWCHALKSNEVTPETPDITERNALPLTPREEFWKK